MSDIIEQMQRCARQLDGADPELFRYECGLIREGAREIERIRSSLATRDARVAALEGEVERLTHEVKSAVSNFSASTKPIDGHSSSALFFTMARHCS